MTGEETLTSGSSSSSADSPLHKVVLGAVKEVFKVSYEIMVWMIRSVQGWCRIAIMTITLWDIIRNLAINHQASPSTNLTKIVFQDLSLSSLDSICQQSSSFRLYWGNCHPIPPHSTPFRPTHPLPASTYTQCLWSSPMVVMLECIFTLCMIYIIIAMRKLLLHIWGGVRIKHGSHFKQPFWNIP